ncbi:hypothetical protein HDV00_011968 [Rhizophlyctis rosea]|nr:hypothetical protein HDV00_011968 [Rhizophlyctis rosea]
MFSTSGEGNVWSPQTKPAQFSVGAESDAESDISSEMLSTDMLVPNHDRRGSIFSNHSARSTHLTPIAHVRSQSTSDLTTPFSPLSPRAPPKSNLRMSKSSETLNTASKPRFPWIPRSRSSLSLSQQGLVSPSAQATPSSTSFRRIIAARVKYLIASIDLNALYTVYDASRSAGSSFTTYAMKYLAEGLKEMPCTLAGVLLTGLKPVAETRSSGNSGLVKFVDALRGEKEEGWNVPVVLLDEYGLEMWADVRDKVNGILLENLFFKPDGTEVVRFGYNLYRPDRATFDALTKKVSLEVSLRIDFVVLDRESLSIPLRTLSAAIIRRYVQWHRGLSIVGWYTRREVSADGASRRPSIKAFGNFEELCPIGFDELGDDSIFEMATQADIVECRNMVQDIVARMRATGVTPDGVERNIWKGLLHEQSDIPRGWVDDLVPNLFDKDVGASVIEKTMLKKPKPPDPPSFYTISDVVESMKHVERPSISDRTSGRVEGPVSMNHFGYSYGTGRRKEVTAVVTGVMFDLLEKNLLASAQTNVDAGGRQQQSTPEFSSLLNVLSQISQHPTNATRWILGLFGTDRKKELLKGLVSLREGLDAERIKVWLPTKAAFQTGVKTDLPYDNMWGIAEEKEGRLHLFIQNTIPDISEAVLHLYFKERLGWTTGECVLVESLVSAQNQAKYDMLIAIPSRMVVQVEQSCPSVQLDYVREEPRKRKTLWTDGYLTADGAGYLIKLAEHLSLLAEFRLIQHEQYMDEMKSAAAEGYAFRTKLEEKMGLLVGECTLSIQGSQRLLNFARGISSEIRKRGGAVPSSPMLGGPVEMWALCYLFSAFWKACRWCAFQELEVSLQSKNPALLPESDQAAVSIEMTTTASTLATIFDLTSLQLSLALHPRLRERLKRERHAVAKAAELDAQTPSLDNDVEDSSTIAFKKSIANAYIFVYPILLDIILILAIGCGIFAGDAGPVVQEITSLVFLVINSIGRSVTYYFYQKSIPLMIATFYRRLTAAIVIFTFWGLVLGIVTYFTKKDPVYAIFAFLYAVAFAFYMLFFSTLLILRNPDDYFYKSAGPIAVLKSVALLVVNAFIVSFVVLDDDFAVPHRELLVWGLYIACLFIATGYMLFCFTRITAEYLRWPKAVSVTPKSEILALYEKIEPRPTSTVESDVEKLGRMKRRWERSATEWFSSEMLSALRDVTGTADLDPIVRSRASQWFWENMLMKWFLERSGIEAPKAFSSEWDGVLRQGLAELKKKFQVEKMNRGDILFANEWPAITFGFLYFVLIFADRWSILLVSGKAVSFFPTEQISDEYMYGGLTSVIFLLLASGLLELTLTRFYTAHRRISMTTLAESKTPTDVFERYRQSLQRLYNKELGIFVLYAMPIFIITTGALSIYAWYTRLYYILQVYFISAIGYVGLLVGLFQKLFIAQQESLVNTWLAVGNVVSIAGTGAAILLFEEDEYGIFAAPALTSSGQRLIGQKHNDAIEEARNQYAQSLYSARKKPMHPGSPVGQRIKDYLESAADMVSLMPPNHIFQTALSVSRSLMVVISNRFGNKEVLVYKMKDLLQSGGCSYSAISVQHTGQKKTNRQELHVFVSPLTGATDAPELEGTILAEALVHEFVESGGLSHASGCVAECVLAACGPQHRQDGAGVADVIPERIKMQIRAMGHHEKQAIRLRTREMLIEKTSFGVEVDCRWHREGGMLPEDRQFMVQLAKIWWAVFEEVHNSLLSIIRGKGPPKAFTDIKTHASQSIILAALAVSIQKFCAEQSSPRIRHSPLRTSLSETFATQPPFWRRLFHAALNSRVYIYLALIADPRLGRELSHHPPLPLRLPLALLHKFTRFLLTAMHDHLLHTQNHSVNLMLKEMNRGLRRIHHIGDGGGHAVTVETYHGVMYTTIGVVRDSATDGQEEEGRSKDGGYVIVDRYKITGAKPANWKPGPGAECVGRGFYRRVEGGMNLRLSHEEILNAIGEVMRTHIYKYTDEGKKEDRIPFARFIFEGRVDADQWLAGQYTQSKALQVQTLTKKGNDVVVTESVWSTLHKHTREPARINATHTYMEKDPEGAQISAQFRASLPVPWTMTVHYARLSKGNGVRPTQIDYSEEPDDVQYTTRYDYSHPKHVQISTVKFPIGEPDAALKAPTPTAISEDVYGVIFEPSPPSLFESSDFYISGMKSVSFRRWSWRFPFVSLERKWFYDQAYTALRKRENLWASWRRGELAGVFAMELDERFLRDEPLLKAYWRKRDFGDVKGAKAVLKDNKQKLNAELQVTDRPLTRTHLQIRYSDLYVLGVGGDAHKVFAGPDAEEDKGELMAKAALARSQTVSSNYLQLVNVDSGTWPTSGGGVGSCRRDLIAGLTRFRWSAIAEIGTAELVQQDYPIEQHINSIIYLPLWDVDFGNPSENVYRTIPYQTLNLKARNTTTHVVNETFVPLIKKLIEGCLKTEIKEDEIDGFVDMFVGLHHFFAGYDWVQAWDHVATQEAWVTTWLNGGWELWKTGQLVDIETPTLRHIEMLYDLIARLLLPLTVKIPKLPVIHSSHHGVQAVIGVIAKRIYGSTFVVWDHGILWRERLFALCFDENMPRFVQIGFAGLTRLVTRIVFANADCITPCTSIQNVAWEAWLGGGKYNSLSASHSIFTRTTPVLNGMDVTKFKPNPSATPPTPTAIMLSHISPVKDVLNAISAANILINTFHLTSYQLHIYGSVDKDPSYTAECERAIANWGLADKVIMKGLGSPSKVLPTGWVFVNSSITEGLPLALGEAGLCGLPVVCTDVGGSREVIWDVRTGEVCGAIVPPSKPMQLALAQLRVMAVADGVGKWVEGGVEDVTLDSLLVKQGALEKRVMDPDVGRVRREIGMRLRERIMSVFSIKRYWREHEQVCWLGPLYEKQLQVAEAVK